MNYGWKQGNTTVSFGFFGPIAHLVGFVLSLGVILVGFFIVFVLSMSVLQDIKIKDFPHVTSTVLAQEDESNITVSYVVDGNEYKGTLFVSGEYVEGASVEVIVNPEDPKDIYMASNSDGSATFMMLAIGLLAFVVGISSARTHLNNFLHFLNPQKYGYIKMEQPEDDKFNNEEDYNGRITF